MKTSQKYIISICIPSLHQIDRLLVWLPRCGQPDYIHKFIQCLRESSDDAGDAHSELADVLQEDMEHHGTFSSTSRYILFCIKPQDALVYTTI